MTKKLPPDELAQRRLTAKPPGNKPGRRHGTTPGPESGATAINLNDQQAKALALRLAGANLTQVADELGFKDARSAHRVIMSALKTNLPDETRDEARRRELATLDRLQMAHWSRALAGDEKSSSVVLRCVSQRREMMGLDEPRQVAVSLNDGDMVEVGVLAMLDADQLANALLLRNQIAELSRMRAGAIDAESS